MNKYLDLFLTFNRIGALTFGGGYAMMPMLQKEVIEKKKWATEEEVMDYYALGQCAPGVIAVNTSVFIGNQVGGVFGGISAALGVVCPSLIIIMVIAAFIQNFIHLDVVQYAFAGVRVAVAVLVVNAILKMWKAGVKDLIAFCVFAVAFALTLFTDVSPILIVVGSIVIGIVVKGIASGRKAGGSK
ncbi:chromate transporter [Feifania hominis]|uniref:Chromate transporter n=1 Tax=Feifania hominis TaxID=2763660 RepID=A0A926DFF6_9FIRM|nr:chromate transporter [Feifania hominis]MBC8537163.1 chromate transporter [Feifania hominis]